MTKISIKKYECLVKRIRVRKMLHIKAAKKLPIDSKDLFQFKIDLIKKFAKQFKGKTLEFAILQEWLYDNGVNNHDARNLIWCAVDKNIIKFDINLNIKF